jgi:type I restriction enzyme M protein
MAKTKANEREFQGKVLGWIMKQIGQGGLPFKNATTDSSLYGLKTIKFPDVLLYLDLEYKQPNCVWELKTPETDARDSELLKDAVRKAQAIDAKYFITWNMQNAIIWRTPEKNRTTVTEQYKVSGGERNDPRITSVDDIRDPIKAMLLEEMCSRLLLDLHQLYENEKINLHIADTTVFVGVVSNASDNMGNSILKDLNRQRSSKAFEKNIKAWGTKQGIGKYDEDYWVSLSRQIAYKIIGKILFYMSLRRSRIELPKFELSENNYKQAIQQLRNYFQKALEVDYQAIFESDITDEIELSHQTIDIIVELAKSLTHWSFELAPLDVVGKVFEDVIPQEARHSLGQYFTPKNLVDLIVAFCVRSGGDCVMDPTCGTGTFLIRSYNRLKQFRAKSHHELLDQIWGFDIAGFPAELATINLCRQNFGDYLNFPRVLRKDFFEVQVGDEYEFPPPKRGAKVQDRIPVKLPRFDALVGNFPFIRQELIQKVDNEYKEKLETVLSESWLKEYPDLFKTSGGHELQLSGQADIYAYMFFHAASHLKEGGRMGFITSNSWLDVAYGYELQKFFLNKFKLIAICESRCEPWFEQSSVNTVFTVLERSDDIKANRENLVRFVKFKKPLSELFPEDSLVDVQKRWIKLEQFVDRIDGICATGQTTDKKCKKFEKIESVYVKEPEIISYEDEDIRMRIVKQGDLKDAVQDEGETVKWGKYLRGPDVYFEILEKCADKLVPLRKVAEISRGFTTGVNEFFYLTDDKIKHWGIEEEFLKPVLKSPKEFEGILIDPAKLTTKVFLCEKSKKELRRERKTRALKYIEWGEKQKTKDGVPWPNVPTVRNRKPGWWALPKAGLVQIFWTKSYDVKHLQRFSPDKLLADQRLYQVIQKDTVDTKTLAGLMNCSLFSLSTELGGRVNLGDGALDTTVEEAQDYLIVPDVTQLTNNQAKKIIQAFDALLTRPIKAIYEEIKMPDRQRMDSLVLEVLGLDPKKYLKPLYDGLCELIRERLSLPKMRTVKKKKRVEQDLGKLKEEISEEIFSDGLRKFPDGFIKKSWSNVEYEEISVPVGKLKIGENFFGKQQICFENGDNFMEVGSEERGKFIVYAKKEGQYVIRMPKSETVVRLAVQGYEVYLREIRDKLIKAFLEQSGNIAVSENLTKQIFEELDLPYLASE